ncbi:MAG: hypothetical protein H7323_01390 [Frankiales bacterium]|nr:hypothetical protein [Frankiales bacterium]
MDPFVLPCHPALRLSQDDTDWRAIGVKSADDVRRKQTRCPDCKIVYTAFLRTVDGEVTVEWVRPAPFRVTATPLAGGSVLWQDASGSPADGWEPVETVLPDLGPAWERSVQQCAPVAVLTAGGEVFAVPGDRLLERREKWNAQDRRLALLWSPRLQRQVVAWHGYARLLQD